MEVEKEDTVDWLGLPDHLTFEIMFQFTSCSDYVSFGAVCVKWRSLLLDGQEEECLKLPPQLPMLIIPTPPSPSLNKEEDDMDDNERNRSIRSCRLNKEEDDMDDNERNRSIRSCSFYRITDGKFYNGLQLSMPDDRHFRGSGHGWLLTVDDDESSNYPIQLINPFFFPNPKVIQLPPLTTFPFEEDGDRVHNCAYLEKGVLSADPISNPEDYMVMAIYGGFSQLALFKAGDKVWTHIGYDSFKGLFKDIIYFRNQFYAVHHYGAVAVCELTTYMANKIIQPPTDMLRFSRKYLVECAGELLQVNRLVNPLGDNSDGVFHDEDSDVEEFDFEAYDASYATGTFKVFKLLLDQSGEKEPNWVEVNDLHGRSLFLGNNASMSISAFDFPGCKPNCIYYTDDNMETFYHYPRYGPHDLGVFDLENRTLEKYYPTDIHTPMWPTPIWIEPTPIWNVRVNANNR